MRHLSLLKGLTMATTLVLAAAHFIAPSDSAVGNVLARATPAIAAPVFLDAGSTALRANGELNVTSKTQAALAAFASAVRPLSHPEALEMAFRSYFAYQSRYPDRVRKPFLYFVDYGLPSTKPRGYVFDMESLDIVDGPFAVAHGRGSSKSAFGVPTRFSNKPGSFASSLGLYLARETYGFIGKAAGKRYRSIGLRLQGVSGDYNDNALARRVVAHGAPYVSSTEAGRSEGCPAIEPARAQRLLPKLAHGGLVFLFAPDARWMAGDPWASRSS